MNNKNFCAYFQIPGVRMGCDFSDPENLPFAVFDDGLRCGALPRSETETQPFGYDNTPESIQLGNFHHEALHLYVTNAIGWQNRGILRRVAEGADIDNTPEYLVDAEYEERLVVGLHILVNRTLEKVNGFTYHLCAAAMRYAQDVFANHGLDINKLAEEARSLLALTCGDAMAEGLCELAA